MRSPERRGLLVHRADGRACRVLIPADTVAGRIKARLALDALFMADARPAHLGGESSERRAAALTIAKQLTQ
jgi:hypothetical protein